MPEKVSIVFNFSKGTNNERGLTLCMKRSQSFLISRRAQTIITAIGIGCFLSQSFLISRRAQTLKIDPKEFVTQTLVFSTRLFFIAFVYFLITAICPYLSFVLKKQFFYFKISKSFSLRKYSLNLDLNNQLFSFFLNTSSFI